jgi:6-bladed beta-propeller protein
MKRLIMLGALLAAAGCSQNTDESPPLNEVLVYTLGEPTLEIGMMDGAEEYLFGQIESVLRLPDGSVAVSDASSTRISVYDAEGVFVRSWGKKGGGPGEFRDLSRIYLSGDSILAADQRTHDITPYSFDGVAGERYPSVDVSGDSVFSLDSWLYRRFWVDGALDAQTRARVEGILDGLPAPTAAPGYRAVLATGNGELWVREPEVSADGIREWTRLTAVGSPNAVIELPVNFDPLSVDADEVLGRWTGEADVSFVHAYQLVETPRTRSIPAWLQDTEDAAITEVVAQDEAEVRSLIVGTIKNMASHQEIYYSGNMTYTTDLSALEDFEQPEGLMIDFLVGNSRGWAGVFSHPGFNRICGLAYGFMIPAGWSPGSVVCAPVTETTTADGGA